MIIVPHAIKGIRGFAFHDFIFREEGDEIVVSAGTYVQNGTPIITIPEETRFPKPEIREWIQHEFWLTENGIKLYSSPEFMIIPESPIDRLGWIMIFAPLPTDAEVELHVLVFEE